MVAVFTVCLPARAQIGGTAGAFSRLGFGARGMGMGNTQTAVTTGDVLGYYNPALLSSAEYRHISASFSVLSFDRVLNFINYTQPLKPSAGLSVGIINAGVTHIDGRDSDGDPTGDLKTSENEFLLSFSNKFRSGFSLGVSVKLLLHHLYTDVNSTTVSADFGALVPIGESLTLGATFRDVDSKYKWDTGKLYGAFSGRTTVDAFPHLYTLGAAYKLPDSLGLVAIDLEASDQKTLIARFGVEVPLIPELTLRAGLDRIDLKEKGNGIKPTFGFTARKNLGGWMPQVHYAFIIEPFSSSNIHVISLSVIL